MKHLRLIFLAVASLLPLAAQISTGEIAGSVTDSSGAAIPNARVILTNADAGTTVRETVSDGDGLYVFTLIPPGNYNVTVEAGGFRKTVQNGVALQTNQRAKVDFALVVGQVSETVEVTATPPQLESSSSSLGTVISQNMVAELPLNGRNFVQLAILTPGVNGTGFSVGGTIMSGTRPDDRRPGTEIFSNGNREGSNNFTYDGGDNNDRLLGLIVLRPAIEAIREFKVQTNLYSADTGRSSGAQVDIVSKSGTNDWHGSAFEFLRNSALDARNFFNAKGTAFPSFRYNQYGGSFGGPVRFPGYNGRNKTFFFVDYEGYRRNQQVFRVDSIPTLNLRRGDFTGENRIFDPLSNQVTGAAVTRTQFPNNQIPAARFDPVSLKLINAYPNPNNSGLVNNYTQSLSQVQNWDQGDVRVDHQLSASDTIFARWSIQHTSTVAPYTFAAVQIPGLPNPIGVGNEDSFAGPAFNPTQHAVASWTRVLSPRAVNDFRVGFSRFVLDYTAEGAVPGGQLGNLLGVRNSNTNPQHSVLPIINNNEYTGVGHSRSLPIFRRGNTFQYSDNLTYTVGAHTLKVGALFLRRQITEYQTNRGNGRFNFNRTYTDARQTAGVTGTTGNTAASFLLGYAALIEQDYTLAWTGQRGIETGLYIADDWRVNKKLTLNLGFRHEYYSPFTEVANRVANFDPATATVLVAGRDGIGRRMNIERNFKDMAPRFGFAYSLNKSTVVRGGYGLFYNPSGNGGALLRLFRHVPFGPIFNITSNGVDLVPRISDGFPAAPGINFDSTKNPTGGVIGVAGNYRSSYAQQFNLTVEREIAPWKTLIKAGYVGNLGRRLHTTIDLNQPLPGTGSVNSRRAFFGVRPGLAGITYAVADGLSAYHGLQIAVEKRMSHGLQVLTGYTWAHSIDTVPTEFGGGAGAPQDIRCRRCDRANSNTDLRHRLTNSATYMLPFFNQQKGWTKTMLGGWQVNSIITLQSGLPYTLNWSGGDVTGGAGGSRPNSLGRDGTLPGGERNIDRWFDPSAYGRPADFTFGNVARNSLFGPGRVNFDASLFKDFAFKEHWKVQFRTEAFNLFNHPQFGQPNANIGTAQAGQIRSIVGNPRQLQLALRLQF